MFSYGFTSNNCVFSFPLKLSLPLICVDPHLSLKGGDLHFVVARQQNSIYKSIT